MVGKAKQTQSPLIPANPPGLPHFTAALQAIPGMVLELNVEKIEKWIKYSMYCTIFISTSYIAIHCNLVVGKLHLEP